MHKMMENKNVLKKEILIKTKKLKTSELKKINDIINSSSKFQEDHTASQCSAPLKKQSQTFS